MAWNWNCFTLEGMCKAKCSLCDQCERPTIHIDELLYNHIYDALDERHKTAYQVIKIMKKVGGYSAINWDIYYKTEQSTRNIFNPKVICESCQDVIPIQGTKIRKHAFIKASPEMTSHLKDWHGIDEKKWTSLKSEILEHAGDYCKVSNLGVIYKCKKCNEIPVKNKGIMFVKHLLDKHRGDEELLKFPWDNILHEVHLLTSKSKDVDINPQDSSSVMSTDRSRQRESISEIERSYSSNPLSSDIRDIFKIIQDTQHQFNIIANVFDEDVQPIKDMLVPPSTQLSSDPEDTFSVSSRKRKNDTQIEKPLYKRKKSNVKLIEKYNDEIFNSLCNMNEEFDKLMYVNEEIIYDLIKEMKKILEEISKDDS